MKTVAEKIETDLTKFLQTQNKKELKAAAADILRVEVNGTISPMAAYILRRVRFIVEDVAAPKRRKHGAHHKG